MTGPVRLRPSAEVNIYRKSASGGEINANRRVVALALARPHALGSVLWMCWLMLARAGLRRVAKHAESASNTTRINTVNKVFIVLCEWFAFPGVVWMLARTLSVMLPQVHLLLNVALMFTLCSEFGSDGNGTIALLLHRIGD